MAIHPQNAALVRRALVLLGARPGLCVDIGSKLLHPHDPHDPRPLVNAVTHIGIDANPGDGVDVVKVAHEYTPPGPVDLVLSLVALEHDPQWGRTLLCAYSWLRPGGVLCITCAGAGCPAHELAESPSPGWYKNVSSDEIVGLFSGMDATITRHDVDSEVVIGPDLHRDRIVWTRTRVLAVKTAGNN